MSVLTSKPHFKDTDKKYPSYKIKLCGLCNEFYSEGFLSTGEHLISEHHLDSLGIKEKSTRNKTWDKFKLLCNHNADFLHKHLQHGFSEFITKYIFIIQVLHLKDLK